MLYKIGILASLFGISPQTIRFYEANGFLLPKRDDTSSTRRYHARNGKWLFSIRNYLALGFTINEIKTLFTKQSYFEIGEIYSEKEKELFDRIGELQNQLAALNRQHHDLAAISRLMHKCEVLESCSIGLIVNQVGDDFDESEESIKAVAGWLAHPELVSRLSIIPKEDMFKPFESQVRKSGYCFLKHTPEIFIKEQVKIERLDMRSVIHTISVIEEGHLEMQHVKDYCESNHLAICGDAVGRIICIEGENDCGKIFMRPKTVYYEYFIPIEVK